MASILTLQPPDICWRPGLMSSKKRPFSCISQPSSHSFVDHGITTIQLRKIVWDIIRPKYWVCPPEGHKAFWCIIWRWTLCPMYL